MLIILELKQKNAEVIAKILDCDIDGKIADVVEAKHGKWERRPDPYGFFHDIPVCSECGCTTTFREETLFCPNCGADMREKRGEI